MGVKVEGLGQLILGLQKVEAEAKEQLEKTLYQIGEAIASDARRRIQKSARGGKTYQLYNPRREHTASAPGESPATDTGRLVSSIVVVPMPELGAVAVKCDSNVAPYAAALEYGTTDGKLQPRPFLAPALAENREKAIEAVRRAVKRALKTVKNEGGED